MHTVTVVLELTESEAHYLRKGIEAQTPAGANPATDIVLSVGGCSVGATIKHFGQLPDLPKGETTHGTA